VHKNHKKNTLKNINLIFFQVKNNLKNNINLKNKHSLIKLFIFEEAHVLLQVSLSQSLLSYDSKM